MVVNRPKLYQTPTKFPEYSSAHKRHVGIFHPAHPIQLVPRLNSTQYVPHEDTNQHMMGVASGGPIFLLLDAAQHLATRYRLSKMAQNASARPPSTHPGTYMSGNHWAKTVSSVSTLVLR